MKFSRPSVGELFGIKNIEKDMTKQVRKEKTFLRTNSSQISVGKT